MFGYGKWVIGVALIQLPLLLGFICCFLPIRRFQRFPRIYKILGTFQYFFPYLFLFATQSMIIWMELRLETHINANYAWDYTPWIYNIEGNIVEQLQGAILHPSITPYFHFIYVVGFTVIINSSIIIYIALKHEKIVRTLTFGIIIMTSIAIPFYIFFPVNEVWVTNPDYYGMYAEMSTNTVNILREVKEGESVTQVFSNVNNCFPSMHTAISMFIAFTLIVNKRKYLAPIFTWISVSIVIATVYLGIHWIIDIIAGITLALSVTYLLYYWNFNFRFRLKYLRHLQFPFRIENSTWKGKPTKRQKQKDKESKRRTKKRSIRIDFLKSRSKKTKGKLLLEGIDILTKKISYVLLTILYILIIIFLNYLPFIPDVALRYMFYIVGMTLLIIGLYFSISQSFFQRCRLYKNGLIPTQMPRRYWFSGGEYFIPYSKIASMTSEEDWVDIRTKSGELARVYEKTAGKEVFNAMQWLVADFKKSKQNIAS